MKLIIVGAGEVGRELIKRLKRDWFITVIDEDAEKLQKIVDLLDTESMNKVVLLQGDGTSKLMLKRAGIEDAKVFAACTGDDEVNIEACKLAKEFDVPSVFAVSNSTENDELYEREDINYVDKAVATASLLERQIKSGIVTPTNIGLGQGEIVEVTVMPTSIIAGYPVGKFSSRRWKIVAIFRGSKLIIPQRNTIVKPGDKVLIVGDPKVLKYIAGLIRSGEPQFPLQFGTEELIFLPERDQNVLKDARFFFENTKLLKVSIYTCFKATSDLKNMFSSNEKKVVDLKELKLCEKEFLEEVVKDENFGLIVMSNKYKEFPLYFGIKTFPILVAEETLSPVMIAKGTTPVNKILVPVSGSFSSFRALEVGIELSILLDTKLTALYVRLNNSDEKVNYLKDKIVKFSSMYKISIDFLVRTGNPVNEFAKISKDYDLSIVGARKGRKTNWFNPYPPYHMIHRSNCSSILVCVGE
ncbi:NAD-binding protein [Desulfurobacterium thermolithotrophum]|uniref:NAD-binding protein n=1 Tax=Desulfurobacterium thermolithotrophum TaxID=64160 RepID=UPI0013D3F3F0|nr:NAD-binding protein [Desulfurobacterium thermolithotrophum]